MRVIRNILKLILPMSNGVCAIAAMPQEAELRNIQRLCVVDNPLPRLTLPASY